MSSSIQCSRCKAANPADSNFCSGCGHDLREASGAALPAQATDDAERRQLTVMFCDLVGSTELAERLDAEDLREIIREYQKAFAEVVEGYGGSIAQYLGDGILVYFGYPKADEHDAERAVRSALGVAKAIEELNLSLERDHSIRIQVRMGIHTGQVVAGEVGAGGAEQRLAMGDTPNIAARLQGLAEPNSAVVSNATYSLVSRAFSWQPLGPQRLRGLSRPMEAYRPVAAESGRSRFDLVAHGELAELVGREPEMAQLLHQYELAMGGEGSAVLISGDAGIGKSRLTHEFAQRLRLRGHGLKKCQCWAHSRNSALHPLIEMVRSQSEIRRQDSDDKKLDKIEALVSAFGLEREESVPLLAALLGVALCERYGPLAASPQLQRDLTMETLLALLLGSTEAKPPVFFVEDLHWADPSTLEFLDLFVERARDTPVLALFTFRPSYSPPWTDLECISLGPLEEEQIESIVYRVTKGKRLPPQVLDHIVRMTDGVPLFVEELTKTVLESGLLEEAEDRYMLTSDFVEIAIPATLHDSLMARLDGLGEAKPIAQLAAVLGREFDYDTLSLVSGEPDARLRELLERIVTAEIVFEQDTEKPSYLFKHALIQDEAYQSMLRSTRRAHHRTIGAQLAALGEASDVEPEIIAHHFTEGRAAQSAIPFWLAAGELAASRSANVEAVEHLNRGLGLTRELAEGDNPEGLELQLLTALGPPLTALRTYASPEVAEVYERARLLSASAEAPEAQFSAIEGLAGFDLVRGEYDRLIESGRLFLELASAAGSKAAEASAYGILGHAHMYSGRFGMALEALEKCFELESSREHTEMTSAQNLTVTTLTCQTMVLWHLGFPDRVLDKCTEALDYARRLESPFDLAFALYHTALAVHPLGAYEKQREYILEALAIAQEHGFLWWSMLGRIVLGWVELEEEETSEQALDTLQVCLGSYVGFGARIGHTYQLAVIANGALRRRRQEQAAGALLEAFKSLLETSEHYAEPEVHRLNGEFLLTFDGAESCDPQHPGASAEDCFRRALEMAQRQGSKAWALRTATDLARLRQSQGRAEEALSVLKPLYEDYQEGFDTLDLVRARETLEALGR